MHSGGQSSCWVNPGAFLGTQPGFNVTQNHLLDTGSVGELTSWYHLKLCRRKGRKKKYVFTK
jgi:hypothetical protein